MSKEPFLLKDHLFNKTKLNKLAQEIKAANPSFKDQAFVRDCIEAFPALELKERISCISRNLKDYLPADYTEALGIIMAALPAPLDPNLHDNDFGDFIYAPYGQFVADYGCEEVHLTRSLEALKEITMRFSAEDAVRIFINRFPEQTIKQLYLWSQHPNYHVRRWCSEGTRPLLPWSKRINISPEQSIPILSQLYTDPTRYVTRSVANHLNDIAKLNPDLVIAVLKTWQTEQKTSNTEWDFICKHSLRTLVKKGFKPALDFLGFESQPHVNLSQLKHSPRVFFNESLQFEFMLEAAADAQLLIDYEISFVGKLPNTQNKKVFKLKTLTLKANESTHIKKQHKLLAQMTTRKLYPGLHQVSILVNGETKAHFSFELSG